MPPFQQHGRRQRISERRIGPSALGNSPPAHPNQRITWESNVVGCCHGETGFFVEPTVLDGTSDQMRVYQEEIFGPW
jgi:hypothetical protein